MSRATNDLIYPRANVLRGFYAAELTGGGVTRGGVTPLAAYF